MGQVTAAQFTLTVVESVAQEWRCRELRKMKMAPSPLHSQRMHRKIAPHPDDSHDYDQDLDILGVVSK